MQLSILITCTSTANIKSKKSTHKEAQNTIYKNCWKEQTRMSDPNTEPKCKTKLYTAIKRGTMEDYPAECSREETWAWDQDEKTINATARER